MFYMQTSSPKLAWPHAPRHELTSKGTYFVTAGTYLKEHHFRSAERLEILQTELLTLARRFEWQLEAWAIFSNHYHFVGHSPPIEEGAESLARMLATG